MKAILLDWDGVLCDSLNLYWELYQEAARIWKKPLPVEDIGEFRRWYRPQWEENYYEMGYSEEEFQQVLQWTEGWLDYSRAALFPGVLENLKAWSREAPLAIVSTTPSALIRRRLERESGALECFQHLTGGEDGESEKRRKVARTLQKLGASGGVMVGDTPLDVDAGQFNGLCTVGVTYGWVTPERVQQQKPTRLVERPDDLFQAVLDCLRMDQQG